MATPASPFASVDLGDEGPIGASEPDPPHQPEEAAPAGDGFGDDLRRLHKRERRALDLEDPYR
jgi:hypothetical protein